MSSAAIHSPAYNSYNCSLCERAIQKQDGPGARFDIEYPTSRKSFHVRCLAEGNVPGFKPQTFVDKASQFANKNISSQTWIVSAALLGSFFRPESLFLSASVLTLSTIFARRHQPRVIKANVYKALEKIRYSQKVEVLSSIACGVCCAAAAAWAGFDAPWGLYIGGTFASFSGLLGEIASLDEKQSPIHKVSQSNLLGTASAMISLCGLVHGIANRRLLVSSIICFITPYFSNLGKSIHPGQAPSF